MSSASDRVLDFQRRHVQADRRGQEPARRGRRVQSLPGHGPKKIKPSQYVLVREEQDREAAFRWHMLNGMRRGRGSVQSKILEYLRANVGQEVSGEELKYLAKDKSSWPRRVRELRTEQGWPIKTKSSGRPDLRIGAYVLEADKQAPNTIEAFPTTFASKCSGGTTSSAHNAIGIERNSVPTTRERC